MGIFDALTGAAGHAAVGNQQQALASLIPQLSGNAGRAYGDAQDFYNTGFGNARADLGQGYGAATGAINTGAGQALGYLGQGQQGALDQLAQARGALTANGGAYAPLSALAGQYGQGAGLYADSLGINGPHGNQRAVSAFQTGPGYDFARNQGIDAITRAANASGGLGGNSLKDTITYGQGLANQEYGNWQNRLQGYLPLQLQATQGAAAGNAGINSGVANTYGAGANLLDAGARAQAGVATGQGSSLSDLASRYFGGLGGLDTGQASALANNTLGANSNNQNLFLGGLGQWNDTLKQDAAVSNAASANSLNLGQNLAKLAIGSFAAGGPFGSGGAFGSGGNPFAAASAGGSPNGDLFPSASFLQNGFGFG